MSSVPEYIQSAARRGLDLLDYAGDGLRPATIREARRMAAGSATPDKVRRMAAWFARHRVDLDSPEARAYASGDSDRPTPGQVAWLLWGGSLGNEKDRARIWAENERDRLIEDGTLKKAISDGVARRIADIVAEHNDKYGKTKGKRITEAMLASVFERGVGAYHTNPESVRPTVHSPEQWAYGRISAFLYAVRNNRYRGGTFDTDLLPADHPLSTRKNQTSSETTKHRREPDMNTQKATASPDLVTGLRQTLANVLVFYAAAHRAHWNVMGTDFREYHGLFEDIYSDVYESVDPFAENIRKMKAFPLTLPEMVAVAVVKDDSDTTDARSLAADLLGKNITIIGILKALFDIATAANEQGIANFVAERIDAHEKWDWQLSSSLA